MLVRSATPVPPRSGLALWEGRPPFGIEWAAGEVLVRLGTSSRRRSEGETVGNGGGVQRYKRSEMERRPEV